MNEGFATYFEHIGGQHVLPEADYGKFFVIDRVQKALHHESIREEPGPLSPVIKNPDFLRRAVFNTVIQYRKGSSVVRMLSHIVGPEKFLATLKDNYLKKHKFGSVGRDELWTAIGKAAGAGHLPGKNVALVCIF